MVFIWYLLTTKNELFLEFQASYFSTLKKLKKTKVDTDYVDVPERDFMLTLKFREAFQTYDMEFPILLSEMELPDPYPMILPSNTPNNRFH